MKYLEFDQKVLQHRFNIIFDKKRFSHQGN